MKKVCIVALGLLSLCVQIQTSGAARDFADLIIEKEDFAVRARQNNTNGFQGCKNKTVCGEQGVYCQEYSKEGFCNNCDFAAFPERYVACLFCRKPVHDFYDDGGYMLGFKSSVCYGCNGVVEHRVKQNIGTQNDANGHQWNIEFGISDFLKQVVYVEQRKFIPAFGASKVYRNLYPLLGNAKLHLYLGAKSLENGNLLHIWKTKLPKIQEANKRAVTTREEAREYAAAIFAKYNLFGPETGTPFEGDIPEDAVTFEEQIVLKD